jgi:hypothetical protein
LTVDYKIRIENGGVTITQHVETAGSSNSTQPQAVAGNLTVLATSFAGSKAAKAATQGGDPVGQLGHPPLPGGDPVGQLGHPPLPGGDPVGPLGRGAPDASSASGQITIFAPVVIDATGLLHKCQTSQTSEEKHKES